MRKKLIDLKKIELNGIEIENKKKIEFFQNT